MYIIIHYILLYIPVLFGVCRDEFIYERRDSSEDEQAFDDEDDENAENNWRNDYPDDDTDYLDSHRAADYFCSDGTNHRLHEYFFLQHAILHNWLYSVPNSVSSRYGTYSCASSFLGRLPFLAIFPRVIAHSCHVIFC